jgi:hypothetical protein
LPRPTEPSGGARLRELLVERGERTDRAVAFGDHRQVRADHLRAGELAGADPPRDPDGAELVDCRRHAFILHARYVSVATPHSDTREPT